MTVIKQKMPDGKTGITDPKRILEIITDANTPNNHRHNLSTLVITWMKHNNECSEEEMQSVYLTYHVLQSALKTMEGMNHE